jgi:undecaprenyl diphosphate synthase
MRLFGRFLAGEAAALRQRGVRLSVIGRRDRLPPAVRAAVVAAEQATARGRELHLRLAVDYSARDMIVAAAGRLAPGEHTRADFVRRLGQAYGDDVPDVDLLIRTGGEQRLSDFLLWECAYAELLFTPTMWPDFGPAELAEAIGLFGRRERRFGALPVAPGGAR